MGDIEAMFYQVKVTPAHRNVLRFLWWPENDTSKEPESYRMTVHLFGGKWCPSLASYALRKTASDNSGDFGEIVTSTVVNSFYVDDCLKSVHSELAAKNLVLDLCKLLSKGGFRLTKWTSNSQTVLHSIPCEERAAQDRPVE